MFARVYVKEIFSLVIRDFGRHQKTRCHPYLASHRVDLSFLLLISKIQPHMDMKRPVESWGNTGPPIMEHSISDCILVS